MKKIPNILTTIRFLLVPLYIYLIFFHKPLNIAAFSALIVFIAASLTDWLDGWLARKYNVISNFGKIMDPLADKFLVGAALISLALPPINYISLILVFIILFREISVTILRKYYSSKNIYIAANIWGKFKTVTQMVGIIAALLYFTIFNYYKIDIFTDNRIVLGIRIFFWITALITVLSGMSYFMKLFKKD